MSSLKVTPDELRTLDTMRQSWQQLSNSIESLKLDVINNKPLPICNSESLHAMQNIIFKDIVSIRNLMDHNSDLFQRLVVHPSTNFPGRSQENVLMQLLRKKPEPNVQEVMEQGRQRGLAVAFPDGTPTTLATAGAAGSAPPYVPSKNTTAAAARTEELSSEQLTALRSMWSDMRTWMQARVIEYATKEANEIYTKEEREMGIENVQTGLKHNLDWDSEDDEDDEEDTSAEAVAKREAAALAAMPVTERPGYIEPERILSFIHRMDWELPANIEFASQQAKPRASQSQRR
ncbi:hypothetical protein TD95_003776 [Thielaviopsis punctulata]|uniref:Mediator of RNA polymerase II transcription subunit 8 n=1 Tax=Thielaviopsis punctulata TaxID=72032 RepID=A0A0F4ZID2_9PEZI|nr:hypothetical protein TD95_003776 [Thielaviopsis punctulata]